MHTMIMSVPGVQLCQNFLAQSPLIFGRKSLIFGHFAAEFQLQITTFTSDIVNINAFQIAFS